MADELDIIAFRRALHRRPELSFRETGTHDLIARTLDGLGIAHRTVARTGVLARIEGRGDLRRAVVLRADIDALPIREQADVAWRSLNDGVMHACGHDVHTAVLMGVLQEFNRSRDFEGTLLGLFQPGEECNPGGASLVLAEEPFADYDVRAVIGEHVEPSLEVGTFGFRAGKYMASSDELRFTVHGTGGHAALRNQLRDPVAAAAELVGGLLALNLPERVLSIGRIEADGATNVVPDDRLEGTLRTFDEALRCASYDAIRDIAASADRRYGTRTAVDIGRGYPCVVNDPALASLARSLAAERWQAVDLPLIAAGGIATGAGMLAAFALGAEGCQLGTRFALSRESSACEAFKRRCVEVQEGGTILTLKKVIPTRLVRNGFCRTVEEAESRGADAEELSALIGRGRPKRGIFEGDLDEGELEIGQIAALIEDLPPAGEILRRLVAEYEAARGSLGPL